MRLLRYLHLSVMALAIVDVTVAQSNGYANIQKLDSVLAASLKPNTLFVI